MRTSFLARECFGDVDALSLSLPLFILILSSVWVAWAGNWEETGDGKSPRGFHFHGIVLLMRRRLPVSSLRLARVADGVPAHLLPRVHSEGGAAGERKQRVSQGTPRRVAPGSETKRLKRVKCPLSSPPFCFSPNRATPQPRDGPITECRVAARRPR